MKITLDLPDALVQQVTIHAEREGLSFDDAMVELLRRGLASVSEAEADAKALVFTIDEKTGLPLIVCQHAAPPDEEMTPERVADLLLAQEVEWHHAAG